MNIYVPLGIEDGELAHPLNTSDFESFDLLIDGTSRIASWKPLRMALITREHDGRALKSVDAPWLGSHALVVKRSAVDAMAPAFQKWGELLTLSCEDCELFVFNPLVRIDALDEDASQVDRFSSGSIMRIKRHVFRADRLADVAAFKIPNLRVSPTYVSQEFVSAWRMSNLSGLRFERVWSSSDHAA